MRSGSTREMADNMNLYSLKRSTMRPQLFNATYDQAQYWAREGIITAYEWRAFKLASTWIAARFGGNAANDQEVFFCKCGWDALINRRTRALKLWNRFCFDQAAPCWTGREVAP